MRKQTIFQYTTPLDALIAITKRLGLNEGKYNIESDRVLLSVPEGRDGR